MTQTLQQDLAYLQAQHRIPTLAGVAITVAVWAVRRRTRRHLVELDDHLLRDVGLTRRDAFQESKRAFWLS